MKFKIKNLEVDFSYADLEGMGDSYFSISKEDMFKFINANTDESEAVRNDLDKDVIYDICSFLGYYKDEVINWVVDGEEETEFSTYSVDLQIIIMNWFIEEEVDVKIEYQGENPFWLLHDICHAEKDVVSYNVYVTPDIEEQRVFDGMELAREFGLLSHVNLDLIKNLRDEFKRRWNYNFNYYKAENFLNNIS